MREVLCVSERRACRTLGQHRSTQRKIPCGLPDEERLTEDIIELTREYGRYGYRMIAGMLNNYGLGILTLTRPIISIALTWLSAASIAQSQEPKAKLRTD